MILSDLQQQISDLARDFARDRLAPGRPNATGSISSHARN